jgi:NlpC/P60 family
MKKRLVAALVAGPLIGAMGIVAAPSVQAAGGYAVSTNQAVAYLLTGPSTNATTMKTFANGTAIEDIICSAPGDKAGVAPYPTNATWDLMQILHSDGTRWRGYMTDMRTTTYGNGGRTNLANGGYWLRTVGIPDCTAALTTNIGQVIPATAIDSRSTGAALRTVPSSLGSVISILPANKAVDMVCYTDTGIPVTVFYTSDRWFKVNAVPFSPGFVHSSLVVNQKVVPPCPPTVPTPSVSPAADAAANWAYQRRNQTNITPGEAGPGNTGPLWTFWSGGCEAFVESSYRYGANKTLTGYPSAQAHADAVSAQLSASGVPPRGALVFYNWGTAGHVAISMGDGTVVGTQGDGSVALPNQQTPYNAVPYVTFRGWYLP